jgi:hypothetical protein
MTNLLTRSGRAAVAVAAGATVAASFATGTAAGAAPRHATAAVHQAERCRHPLPDVVLGNPGVKAQATEGFYVFHDGDWQVRVTHPGNQKVVFAGVITSTRVIDLKTRHLEKRDHVAFANHHRTVVFRFTNYGAIDGLSLNTHCSEQVTFKLLINGQLAPVASMFEGKDKVAGETSNPFTVQRSDETTCATGTLPAEVLGDPHVTGGAAQGTYLYNNGVWHLRVTHPKTTTTPSSPVVFSGMVQSDRPMTIHRFRLEKQTDIAKLSGDRKTLIYSFTNYGALDGVDIDTHCAASVTFTTYVAGAPEPATEVFLGATGAHPATDPFTEVRTVPTPV